MPLDSDGQPLALTGRVNYGSRSEEPTYEASGVYSKNWDTSGGRFGLLANAAYSNIVTRTEAVNMTRISHPVLRLSAGRRRIPDRQCRRGRQRRLQQQSVRRHRLALRAGPGEFLAGGL